MSGPVSAAEGRTVNRNGSNLAGIGFSLAALMIYATLNLVVKGLSVEHGVVQLVFFRQVLALPPIALMFVFGGGMAALRTRNWRLHVLRGFLGMSGTAGIFYGLGHMPLADVVSISFVSPILSTALSGPLLGETVGIRRWVAVAAGLAGALVITRPGGTAFNPAAIAVTGGCLMLAVHVLLGRRLSREESSATITFYYVLGSSLIAGVALPFQWQPISGGDAWMLVMLGILNGVGLLALTESFRRAQASVLAPFDYLHLVLAILFGYLLWNEIPAWHVVIGAGIVISACLANFRIDGPVLTRPRPRGPTVI